MNIYYKDSMNKFHIDQNTIVIGDSHTRLAIDDKLFTNSRNYSLNSEGYYYSLVKLKFLKKTNPHINRVLLGYSYHNISSYYDDAIFGKTSPPVAARYFFIMPLNIQFEVIFMNKYFVQKFTEILVNGVYNFFAPPSSYTFLGSYSNYETSLYVNQESIKRRINSQYFEGQRLRDFSIHNIKYLKKIIDYCDKYKIKLILINTPLHYDYKNLVPKEYKDKYYSIIEKYELNVVEFNDLKLSDYNFLPDGDHLSESGAKLASTYLTKLLNSNLF